MNYRGASLLSIVNVPAVRNLHPAPASITITAGVALHHRPTLNLQLLLRGQLLYARLLVALPLLRLLTRTPLLLSLLSALLARFLFAFTLAAAILSAVRVVLAPTFVIAGADFAVVTLAATASATTTATLTGYRRVFDYLKE